MSGDHGVVGVDVDVRRHRTVLHLGAAIGAAVEGGAAPLARLAREARAGTYTMNVARRKVLGQTFMDM